MDLSNPSQHFPLPVSAYQDSDLSSLSEILSHRIAIEPLNLALSGIFLCAILHTFFAARFAALSKTAKSEFWKEIFHFLGEVEIPFGLWTLPLILLISFDKGWDSAEYYVNQVVRFDEAIFVVVVMGISASRPVVFAAESSMRFLASLLGASPAAWWFCILTVGPLLGSFVTEPAAMTVCAMLLGRQFFDLRPSKLLSYLTLGALFLNVSIGGSLTHFAAPPVLMVANKWGWDSAYMLAQFGWKAALSLLVINLTLLLLFLKEFRVLAKLAQSENIEGAKRTAVPAPVIFGNLCFLAWSVLCSHQMAFLVGGFLMFLGFVKATAKHQSALGLRSALLVGFFLAGLIVHGGLQAWWIEPLLSRSSEFVLFSGSLLLSAFNDNAAITYLATFAPNLGAEMQYLVVAGALCGGGLTVIANAPNPIGFSLLGRYFPEGISALYLALAALFPTIVAASIFLAF